MGTSTRRAATQGARICVRGEGRGERDQGQPNQYMFCISTKDPRYFDVRSNGMRGRWCQIHPYEGVKAPGGRTKRISDDSSKSGRTDTPGLDDSSKSGTTGIPGLDDSSKSGTTGTTGLDDSSKSGTTGTPGLDDSSKSGTTGTPGLDTGQHQ